MKKVELSVLTPSEAKWFSGTGEIHFTKPIEEKDTDLFFDTVNNRYVPNKLAKDFGITFGNNTGSYGFVFDASTITVLYKFLKKYYDVTIVKSEGTQYLEDQIALIKNRYKNDPVSLAKNLDRFYKDNEMNSILFNT